MLLTSLSPFPSFLGAVNGPDGLAFDAGGNLYVVNEGNGTVSKVTPALVPTTSVTIQSSVESRPMEIGGSNNSAVAGINLTSAELARIVTSSSGTVTIGDSNQTGNITFDTATPGTTAGAATVVVESTSGAGQIILDNHTGGTATALSGNTDTVTITAGTGGIVEAAGNVTGTADIGSASAVSLTSSGPIGTSSNPVQLAAPTRLTTDTSANNTNQFLSALTSVTITSLNAGTGTINLIAGTFTLNGSITGNVDNSGTFQGSGTVNGNVSGTGTFSPGDAPGTMIINGSFTPSGTVNFEVDSPYVTAGTDYDHYIVSGTVDLIGATLTFTNKSDTSPPAPNAVLTLISNTSGSATVPSSSPPDGSTVSIGSRFFDISYNGGASHDVVLVLCHASNDG